MLSLSSIELLLWVGLLSLLPLVCIVLRGTMSRVRQREDALRAAKGRTPGGRGGKRAPLQPHISAAQAKSRQAGRRDRAA